MFKKTLLIVLTDGREIARDISGIQAPIGAMANDEFFAKLCQSVCVNGYTDPGEVNQYNYTHLSPSQIKNVSVKFEKHGAAA